MNRLYRWFMGNKCGDNWLIILLISVNFWDIFVFILTKLRNHEFLGVCMLDVTTADKIDVPALSSYIKWPNCLIEQCNTVLQCFVLTLSHTVVIYYPLLHNLAHFVIHSYELHQRSVRSFIFPVRMKLNPMKINEHYCPHPICVVKLTR